MKLSVPFSSASALRARFETSRELRPETDLVACQIVSAPVGCATDTSKARLLSEDREKLPGQHLRDERNSQDTH